MSTSNVKSPIINRVGFILDWKNQNAEILRVKNLLSCELNNLNLVLVSIITSGDFVTVTYYKWLQSRFLLSSVKQAYRQHFKHLITSTPKFEPWFQKHLCSTRRFNNGYIQRLKGSCQVSRYFFLPSATEQIMRDELSFVYPGKEIIFINVFNHAHFMGELANVADPIFLFSSNPILRPWSTFKFNLDAIVVFSLISLNFASSSLLVELIHMAFTRNSRKGQQRRYLQYLQKLMVVLQQDKGSGYIHQSKKEFYVIEVRGKFAVTGRTQKFLIQPHKLPLHTLVTIFDYAEGAVNTKAGTFSIRVWRKTT